MLAAERILELVITVVLIIGGYQFYFWAQRQTFFKARKLETRWDGEFEYDPRWVWIYCALYYPMILLAALSVPTWRDYAIAAGGFLALLAAQMFFFIFFPVEIPSVWRAVPGRWHGTYSQDLMDLVWSYDKLRNSMPSMHVSVATMVDLTIYHNWPHVGHVGALFPILIAVSAIKTKQHYVVDVIPGAVLGAAVWILWMNWWY